MPFCSWGPPAVKTDGGAGLHSFGPCLQTKPKLGALLGPKVHLRNLCP